MKFILEKSFYSKIHGIWTLISRLYTEGKTDVQIWLITLQNSGYVAFPPTAHGFMPSPLQSPYLTSPLAQINPAMMSFLAASPTSAEQSVAAAMSNAVSEKA